MIDQNLLRLPTLASTGRVDYYASVNFHQSLCLHAMLMKLVYEPFIWANGIKYLKVQPPQTESPLTVVSICALEISAPGFSFRWNVPAATSFICNQRQTVCIRDCANKRCIFTDWPKTVANIQSWAPKLCECWRKVGWLSREDNVRGSERLSHSAGLVMKDWCTAYSFAMWLGALRKMYKFRFVDEERNKKVW